MFRWITDRKHHRLSLCCWLLSPKTSAEIFVIMFAFRVKTMKRSATYVPFFLLPQVHEERWVEPVRSLSVSWVLCCRSGQSDDQVAEILKLEAPRRMSVSQPARIQLQFSIGPSLLSQHLNHVLCEIWVRSEYWLKAKRWDFLLICELPVWISVRFAVVFSAFPLRWFCRATFHPKKGGRRCLETSYWGKEASSRRVYEHFDKLLMDDVPFLGCPRQHHRYRSNYHRRHHFATFQTLIISFFLDSTPNRSFLRKKSC